MNNLKWSIEHLPLVLKTDYFIYQANLKSIEKYTKNQLCHTSNEPGSNYQRLLKIEKSLNGINREHLNKVREESKEEDPLVEFYDDSQYPKYIALINEKEDIFLIKAKIGFHRQFRYKFAKQAEGVTAENMLALSRDKDSIYIGFLRLVRESLLEYIQLVAGMQKEGEIEIKLARLLIDRVLLISRNRTVYGKCKQTKVNKETNLENIENSIESESVVHNSLLYIINHYEGRIIKKEYLIGKTKELFTKIQNAFNEINSFTNPELILEFDEFEVTDINDVEYRKYSIYQKTYSENLYTLYTKFEKEEDEQKRLQLSAEVFVINELQQYYTNQKDLRVKQHHAQTGWDRYIEEDVPREFSKIQDKALSNLTNYLGYNLGLVINGGSANWMPDAQEIAQGIFKLVMPLISSMPGGSFLSPFLQSMSSTFWASNKPSMIKMMNNRFDNIDKQLAEISESINNAMKILPPTILKDKIRDDIIKIIRKKNVKVNTEFRELASKVEANTELSGAIKDAAEALKDFKTVIDNLFETIFGKIFKLEWEKGRIVEGQKDIDKDSLFGAFDTLYRSDGSDYDIIQYYNDLEESVSMFANFIQTQFGGLGYIAECFAIIYTYDCSAPNHRNNEYWNNVFNAIKISNYTKVEIQKERGIIKYNKSDFVNIERQIIDAIYSMPKRILGEEMHHKLYQIHNSKGIGRYFNLVPTVSNEDYKKTTFVLSVHNSRKSLKQHFFQPTKKWGFSNQTFKLIHTQNGTYLSNGIDLGRSKISAKKIEEGQTLDVNDRLRTGFKFIRLKDNQFCIQPVTNKKLNINVKENTIDDNVPILFSRKPEAFSIIPINTDLTLISPEKGKKREIVSNAFFMPGTSILKGRKYFSQNREYYLLFNEDNATLEIYKKNGDLEWPQKNSKEAIQGDILRFDANGILKMEKFVEVIEECKPETRLEVVYQSDECECTAAKCECKSSPFAELYLSDEGSLQIREEGGFVVWEKNSKNILDANQSFYLNVQHKGVHFIYNPTKSASYINKEYRRFSQLYHFNFLLNEDGETYTVYGKNNIGEERYLSYDKESKTIQLIDHRPKEGFFIPYHPQKGQYLFQPKSLSRFPAKGFLKLSADQELENNIKVKMELAPSSSFQNPNPTIPSVERMPFMFTFQNELEKGENYCVHPIYAPSKIFYSRYNKHNIKTYQLEINTQKDLEYKYGNSYHWLFKLEALTGNNVFRLRNNSSNEKDLAIDDYDRGNVLRLHGLTDNENQKWEITPSDTIPGFHTIQSTIPGKDRSFDLYGGSTADGAKVELYETQPPSRDSYKHQLWWFEKRPRLAIKNNTIYRIRPSWHKNNTNITVTSHLGKVVRKLELENDNSFSSHQSFLAIRLNGGNTFQLVTIKKMKFGDKDFHPVAMGAVHEYDKYTVESQKAISESPPKSQQWVIKPNDKQLFFSITSVAHGNHALEYSTGDDNVVKLTEKKDDHNQYWIFEEL